MRLFPRTLFASTLIPGLFASLCVCPLRPAAQQATRTPTAAAAPSTTTPGLIGMCEDSDGCSDWGFSGNQGIGLWADGANAALTLPHLDATSIAVHRVDAKGTGAGIVADYSGTITNNWIEGDVAATWAGHQQGTTHTKWHGLIFPSQAVVLNTAKDYAAQLKQATAWTVCHDTGDKCSAAKPPIDTLLVLAGSSAAMRMLPDASAEIFLYVGQLSDGSIQIRRFDKAGILGGATVVYTGKREGGKITGTIKTLWPGHGNTPSAGKFVALAAPTRCAASTNAPIAVQTGLMANLLEDKSESLNCFQTAATQGDAGAQATTGLYYYTGWGTAVDYKKALYWLQKAGDQDDALVARSVMYLKGQGVPVDLLLSHYLADQVELRKRYRLRYPQGSPGPLPGMEGLVNTMGDAFAWIYNLGGKYQIKPLETKVLHEQLVVEDMQKGKSRVQAEEKFHTDLQAHHAANRGECKLAEVGDQPEFHDLNNPARAWNARQKAEQNAEGSFAFCQMIDALSESSFQEKVQGYRACVEKNVDSNTIEKNCEFPLPRFGF